MDSKFAKNVFMALAKKLSFSSIVRETSSNDYAWIVKFETDSKNYSLLGVFDGTSPWAKTLYFRSETWDSMLQELEGKTIAIGSERIPVNSIEQLVVELELEGFLDIA